MKPERKTIQEIQDGWNKTDIQKLILEASRQYEKAISKRDEKTAEVYANEINNLLLKIQ